MTKLERATQTRDAVRWAITATERWKSLVANDSLYNCRDYWESRVHELEAAEKETEPAKPDPQPTMSMSELEIWEALQRYVRRLDAIPPKDDTYPAPEVVAFIDENIAALKFEAAEKEGGTETEKPEPSTVIATARRVRYLEGNLREANAKIEELERKVEEYCGRQNAMSERIDNIGQHLKAHKHCNGDSGRCYYP